METNNWLQVAGLGIAIVTIILAILEFRRNKRIELQNIVYKFKLDCFSNLVGKFDEILDLYNQLIVRLEDLAENGNNEIPDNLVAFEDQSEIIIGKHCTEIMKYSVAFPEVIVNECADFINNQYGSYEASDDLQEQLRIANEFYHSQLNHADLVYKLIREDLGLEKINQRLYDRS